MDPQGTPTFTRENRAKRKTKKEQPRDEEETRAEGLCGLEGECLEKWGEKSVQRCREDEEGED